jgi:hypothetical protein
MIDLAEIERQLPIIMEMEGSARYKALRELCAKWPIEISIQLNMWRETINVYDGMKKIAWLERPHPQLFDEG